MEIKVIEKGKKRLTFEIHGADHTFANSLKKELWNDKNIVISTYAVDHPLIGIPKFIVETNGEKEAEKAILDAVKRLQKKNEQFLENFKKIRL